MVVSAERETGEPAVPGPPDCRKRQGEPAITAVRAALDPTANSSTLHTPMLL